MTTHVLAFKPAIGLYGRHDPSAALFEDGRLAFAVEEERLSREKHAVGTFPERAIRACLDSASLDLGDVDRVVLPYEPRLRSKILGHYVRDALTVDGIDSKLSALGRTAVTQLQSRLAPTRQIENRLAEIGTPVPPVETRSHHACHAASAFHPSGFAEALVLTVDAKGEYDSTVVWRGSPEGLSRLRTYEHPNSLGLFYAVVTEYLGYRMFNGEGKVMGLAPYGERNPEIEDTLLDLIETGVDYDVSGLTRRWGTGHGVRRLEEAFDRPAKEAPEGFTEWEQDLAHTAQRLLEETVVDVVETYRREVGTGNVALAGGVALNCKLNQRIRALEGVEELFVQPVANDAGLAIGAGWLDQPPRNVPRMTAVDTGPAYDTGGIERTLETNKIAFERPADLERVVANRLADGALVGWYQGRLELGPRALGSRSILADPRTTDSLDRVNEFVKHRESWRPFAPSMLESAADRYLEDAEPAPFMIQTFYATPVAEAEIPATLHPADGTTRPQTVRREDAPRYHRLLTEFEAVTGVPVLLNTSFNDHGEPIVNTPTEAIKDFYGMGLDLLVLNDVLVEKPADTVGRGPQGEPAPDLQAGAERPS